MEYKYGVIDYQNFVSDLENWDLMSMAGGLQKSFEILFFDENKENELKKLFELNYRKAVC